MIPLAVFILIAWLAWEINGYDAEQPEPRDPYRWDRWLND